MEQARYWMWTKQTSNNQSIEPSIKKSSYYDSWEEQAFAEDAAASGSLGGCIWPPRSYSCSFCRREFRSAQALGGHMNVHRRDRARLKQSPITPPHNEIPNQQNQILRYQYPNLDRNPAFFHQPTSFPSSRFPAPTIQEISTKQMIPESSFVQENQRMSSPFWSKLVSERNQYITDITSREDIICTSEPGGLRAKDGCKSTDLSAFIMPDNIEKAAGCKRRRTDEYSQVPLASMNNHVQSEFLKLCPSSPEDLDLELRLGDRPKVK